MIYVGCVCYAKAELVNNYRISRRNALTYAAFAFASFV